MADNIETNQDLNDLNELLRVRRLKLKELQQGGKDPFKIVKYDVTHSTSDIINNFEAMENTEVSIAGRLMSKRGMGKASFCDLQDRDSKVQIYVKIDDVGADAYEEFKKLDIGDIVGVRGTVFRTHRGEISVKAANVQLLAKSLQPLPEKWHGLKDVDLRYRQRYLDLIINPDVRKTFIIRSKIIKAIRAFLDNRGFLEVETPILNTIQGGASAKPFITHHNTLDMDMFLRIAPELYLKRLIVGGMEKVYEMGRMFRNEGMSIKHNPEFTMMEVYEAYNDYKGMMELTENLISTVAQEVLGTTKVTYQGQEIDLTPPWNRITMREAIMKYSGIDFDKVESAEEARRLAREKNIAVDENLSKGEVMNVMFEELVEENLIQPTFIIDYPVEISPLTKRKPDNPELTERFELFITGRELANAYSELNDPIDQKERFLAQVKKREAGDDEASMMDNDYINALEYGLPPTGGLGIGIDRLIMLLTDSYSIRDILLFPTMKPIDAPKKESKANEIPNNPPQEAAFVCACDTCPSQEACKAAQESGAAPVEKIDFSNVEIEPLFKDTVDFETFSKSDFRAVKVKECVAVPKSKKLLKFTLDDGTGTDRVILSGIHAFYEPEELIGKTLIAITNLPPRAMMGIESCGMLLSVVHTENGEEKLHLLMVDDHIPAGAKLY
jgi:lysyl-tRNA synthetase class 2